jgi:hypothetical protein
VSKAAAELDAVYARAKGVQELLEQSRGPLEKFLSGLADNDRSKVWLMARLCLALLTWLRNAAWLAARAFGNFKRLPANDAPLPAEVSAEGQAFSLQPGQVLTALAHFAHRAFEERTSRTI